MNFHLQQRWGKPIAVSKLKQNPVISEIRFCLSFQILFISEAYFRSVQFFPLFIALLHKWKPEKFAHLQEVHLDYDQKVPLVPSLQHKWLFADPYSYNSNFLEMTLALMRQQDSRAVCLTMPHQEETTSRILFLKKMLRMIR